MVKNLNFCFISSGSTFKNDKVIVFGFFIYCHRVCWCSQIKIKLKISIESTFRDICCHFEIGQFVIFIFSAWQQSNHEGQEWLWHSPEVWARPCSSWWHPKLNNIDTLLECNYCHIGKVLWENKNSIKIFKN